MRVAAFLTLLLGMSSVNADVDQAWSALREGQAVLLMRHASAPGIGDPEGFVLGDCSTQRNLDERGRLQAQRWGELLRDREITRPRLFSSAWCRAMDTAELMRLGTVLHSPALDSFFVRGGQQRDAQTRELRAFMDSLRGSPPAVLITHQVNITALTGIVPRSGEALVLALPITDPPEVMARILLP